MTQRYLLIPALLAVFATGAFCQEPGRVIPDRVLNIDQSVSLALNNRKEVLLAEKEIKIAQERINEAGSFAYPKIDMTMNYSRVDTDHWMMLPPDFGSLLIPRNTPGDYYITRFSLWQHVYSGGVYNSNLKLAKSNMIRAENQKKTTDNDITLEVKKEFYSLIAADKKLEAYNTAISSMEAAMKNAVPGNTAEKIQARDILLEMKDEYLKMKNRHELQKLEFLKTIGLELNTRFEINETFEPVMETYDLYKLLAWSFKYRPEPIQIQVQEEMDALDVKLSMSARSPTVTLGAHYEFPGETLNFDNKYWNATVNMNIPIYDGFASIYRTRQKSMQKDQNKLKRKDMEDSIQLEVRKAYLEYTFWQGELVNIKKQLDDSRQLLAVAEGDHYATAAAYRSYLRNNVNYIEATREQLTSRVVVEHAIGKPLARE